MKKVCLLLVICSLGITLKSQTDTLRQYYDRSTNFLQWGFAGPGQLMGNQYIDVNGTSYMYTEGTGMLFDNNFEIEVTEVLVWFGRVDTLNGPDDIDIQVWSATASYTPDVLLGQETVTLGVDVDSTTIVDPITLAGMASIPFPTPPLVNETDFFVTIDYSGMVDDTIGIVGNADGDAQLEARVWQLFSNSLIWSTSCNGNTSGGIYYPLSCFWTGDPDIDAMIIPIIKYNSFLSSIADEYICPEESIGLSVDVAPILDNYTVTWSPAVGLSSTNGTSTIASPDTTTTYQIIVEDNDSVYDNDTTYVTVNVFDPPSAAFTVSGDSCAQSAIDFTDNTTGNIAGWLWYFGDGNIDVVQNPSYTYGTGGDYTVLLQVQDNNGCEDTTSQTITIHDKPTANFNYADTCIGNPTLFTDQSSTLTGTLTNWAWDFDDGNNSTQQNPDNTFPSYGMYEVVLIVTNDGNCFDTTVQTVHIDTPQTVDLGPDTSFCDGDALVLDPGTVAPPISWSTGEITPTITVTSGGTYWVSAGSGACQDMDTTEIAVNPLPVVTVAPQDTTICEESSVVLRAAGGDSYSWMPGSSLSCDNCASPEASPVTSTTYYVTGMDTNGCAAAASAVVDVDPLPTLDFTYFVSGAEVTTINNSTNSTNFEWDFGDGNTSTLIEPKHTYAEEGTYDLCLTVLNHCGERTECQEVNIKDTYVKALPGITGLHVYPNPAGEQLHLHWHNMRNQKVTLRVMNVSGQNLYEYVKTADTGKQTHDISTGELPAGMYLLQFTTPEGTWQQKFVR